MKFYKFKMKWGTHAAGAEVELDESSEVTKQYLANEVIEEVKAATPGDEVVDKIVSKLFSAMDAKVEKAAKGPRIEAGDNEVDRQKSFGHWLQLVGQINHPHSNARHIEKCAETLSKAYGSGYSDWSSKEVVKAANIEGSGPAGGYTVPPEYSTDIWKVAMEDTIFASKAKKRPMTSNEFRYPKLDQTGTQATGQTGYLGGVVARWSKETATRTETEPKLKQGVMKAGELTGYSVISNELLQDNAAGLASIITELFGEANSYYMDLATLVGDGVDKPVGVVSAPATIAYTRAGGAGTATLAFADLTNMVQRFFPRSMKSGMWILNQTVLSTLWGLTDGASHLIFQPSFSATRGAAAAEAPTTILGIPVVYTEKTPVFGTKGDILLVDPQGYMVGDRMGLEIAASPHVNFLNNEMTYRFVSRMAGQPMLDKPFTMLDGTNQLSHFVALN